MREIRFHPERLTEAREARGCRMKDLAEAVGASPSAATKWESGEHVPETARIIGIAAHLGVPTSFFAHPRDQALESVFIAGGEKESSLSVAQVRRRLEWTADVHDALADWVDFPHVNLPPAVDQRELTDPWTVEEIAGSVRRLLGIGLGPIHDVIVAMENSGITMSKMTMPIKRISGASAWRGGRPFAVVGADMDGIQTRMAAAVQLGHIVLHRNVADDPETAASRAAQAERFARSLLLPAEGFARDIYRLTPKSLKELKPKWRVSVVDMVERLIELRILEATERPRFYKAISAGGWRSEPGDADMYVEKPSLLSTAVDLLLDEGLMDRRGIAGAVGLHADDIVSICGLPDGHLDVGGNVVSIVPRLRQAAV